MDVASEWLKEFYIKTGWKNHFDLGQLCHESQQILQMPPRESGIQLETARSLSDPLKMHIYVKYGRDHEGFRRALGFLFHDPSEPMYRSK
jgi:hypothetical protein